MDRGDHERQKTYKLRHNVQGIDRNPYAIGKVG